VTQSLVSGTACPTAAAAWFDGVPLPERERQAVGRLNAARILGLEELERMALDNNPTLKQAQARIGAAQGRLRQAGLYPNPVLELDGSDVKVRHQGPVVGIGGGAGAAMLIVTVSRSCKAPAGARMAPTSPMEWAIICGGRAALLRATSVSGA
jgi:hypothetical protein